MSTFETIFVRPNNGKMVTDPATNGFLPEEGREVVNSVYWQRRINDCDVAVVTPTVKAPIKSAKKDA